MREINHHVGVEDVVIGYRQCALIAAAPEDLCQAMHQGVDLFVAARHYLAVDCGHARDLSGKLLVE